MEKISDQKLLRFIKYSPVVFIGLATMVIIGIMFYDNRIDAEEKLASMRSDYIQQEKKRVRQEVDSVYQQLVYEKAHTEAALKREIKQRVYEAHSIVKNIYENNLDKPRDEVIKLIKDVLRGVRFNRGRGYYFIYQMDGTNVLLPHLKHMEDTSLWEFKDSKGSSIIQELVSIVTDKNEGYHRWWFYKPQDLNNDLEKIGFVKYFEPLDWFIGTGEYVEDFEVEIQQRLLNWISEIRYGSSGYIFVIDQGAKILAHQDEEMRNFNGFNLHDSNKNFYIRDLLEVAKAGGGFVDYEAPFKPEGVQRSDKTSYARWFDKWQWTVGSGIYLSDIESHLADREEAIKQQNDAELVKLLLFSFLMASIMFVFATYLSGRLSTRFRKFQAQINHDFDQLSSTNKKMQQIELYDSLTVLPNRIQFTQLVKKYIQEAELSGRYVATVLVDLDNFKSVNDSYGHNNGDKLLAMLGRRFEAILDANEGVSRLGSDQFIFCFPGLVKKHELRDKIEIIQKVFSEDFVVEDQPISVTCSIGIANYPEDGFTAEELVSNADIALYKAKSNTKGGVQYFSPELAAQVEYEFNQEEEA
ncbi:cache domain-containing protein [Vibrio hannami]|uniref:sensor domain-containing diguanylate cyclase n=1 Tax=Vibrio hannami TaxID=2717094 RepID=UPI0024103450|nr:cache domain-containing protein [Vibrio hannami]MDG3087913.1 cache domain-containing protein [Vibrio hannami]